VAYVSDERVDELFELFSAPVDGSASPLLLSDVLPAAGDVREIQQIGERVLYRADQLVDETFELFSVPVDGSAPPVRLSGPLAVGGDVDSAFLVGKSQVVFRADALVNDRDELFRAPLDGSAPPVALTPAVDTVSLHALAPDGSRVAYSTYDVGIERLFVVSTSGGSVPKLVALLGFPATFDQVRFTPDGARLVFVDFLDDDSTITCDLWSARSDGTGLVQLNPGPRFYPARYQLSPDGQRVLYIDRDEISSYGELVSARVDGAGWQLLTPGAAQPYAFGISDDSEFCVFSEREAGQDRLCLDRLDASQPLELLALAPGSIFTLALVPGSSAVVFFRQGVVYSLTAPGVVVALSGAGATTAHTNSLEPFLFSPDSRHVLYRNDEAASGVMELFGAPVDGSAPARRLCPPLGSDRDVGGFRLAPDNFVLYLADLAANERFALFGVPLDGARAERELNGALGASQDVTSFGQPQRLRRPERAP
jgi:hypothetical protein